MYATSSSEPASPAHSLPVAGKSLSAEVGSSALPPATASKQQSNEPPETDARTDGTNSAGSDLPNGKEVKRPSLNKDRFGILAKRLQVCDDLCSYLHWSVSVNASCPSLSFGLGEIADQQRYLCSLQVLLCSFAVEPDFGRISQRSACTSCAGTLSGRYGVITARPKKHNTSVCSTEFKLLRPALQGIRAPEGPPPEDPWETSASEISLRPVSATPREAEPRRGGSGSTHNSGDMADMPFDRLPAHLQVPVSKS